jgi:hypothetical protein
MTVLVGLLACLAPFAVAGWYRDTHARRAHRRHATELNAELSRMDGAAHLAKLRIHGIGLQNGSLRRQVRAVTAERDDAWSEAARTLRRVWRLEAANEALQRRVERLELDGLDRELRELGAGS